MRFVAVVPVLLGPGCRPAPAPAAGPARRDWAAASGPVLVHTDRTQYRPGDAMTLTIVNRGTASYAFNPCTRWLERERESGWEAAQEPDRICTMEAWMLAAGETRTAPTELPAALTPGRYRVVLALTTEGGTEPGTRLEARSAPLTVQP